MISLRKHIDSYPDSLTESALTAFRATLISMGENGGRAVPAGGADLSRSLAGVNQSLSGQVTPESLGTVTSEVGQALAKWADRAFQNHLQNEREIREILTTVASAAVSVGDRDQRFAKDVGDLSGRLRGLAKVDDIAAVRRSIVEETAALQLRVEQMAEENKSSIQELTGQVTEYRERLEKAERESVLDPLTGLANRRAFEQRLAADIERACPFSLVLVDLDDFKSVNDRHGHMAGDDLLRTFATELKGQIKPQDPVFRWGGDEFAAIVSGNLAAAETTVEGIRRWALGEYKVNKGQGKVKVHASASIGFVQWNLGESGVELMARADQSLYSAKAKVGAAR